MKTIQILFLLVPAFAYSQAKTAQDLRAQDIKKYTVESAKITYQISGDAEGEEEMIFTNFGWTAQKKQTMTFELYGIESTQNVLEITDGDFVYRLNEKDSTYRLRKDFKWSQQASYKSPDQVSEAILFGMGGQQQADDQLLDKTCQVWTFEGKAIKELWVWNGLVLKRKAKLGDRLIDTVATQVELNVSPDPSVFIIPTYYSEKN